MGELRLRYVQLLRNAHSFLGSKDAEILIKEAEIIWEKICYPKS